MADPLLMPGEIPSDGGTASADNTPIKRQQSLMRKKSKVKLGVPCELLQPLQYLISNDDGVIESPKSKRSVPQRIGKAASLPVDVVWPGIITYTLKPWVAV